MEDDENIVTDDGELEEEVPQKTYTEQDIQNSFNAGVRKASSEWQKDEKYREFLEWKQSNQDDTDRINELLENNGDLESENEFLWQEIDQLNAQIAVNNSDDKKEFTRFITSEVLNMVDENTDFEQALKLFKRNNPQYFGETVIRKIQSAPRTRRWKPTTIN